MTVKKTLVLSSVLVVLIAIAGGIYYGFRPSPDSVKRLKPDFIISAEDLVNAFEEDEAAANNLYLDKTMQVKGVVAEIEPGQEGKVIIYLEGNMMGSISCLFSEELINEENVSPGEEIELKGKCSGYILDVVLTKCSVVK